MLLFFFCTVYFIWSAISSFSNLNWCSSSPGLFYHVPLKRDRGDWDWRLRWNVTRNTISYNFYKNVFYWNWLNFQNAHAFYIGRAQTRNLSDPSGALCHLGFQYSTFTIYYHTTANPTWGNILEFCFKAQSSKLEVVCCHVSVKRDVRALSFEL